MYFLTKLSAAALCALALTAAVPAMAADEYNVSTGMTLKGAPLGLHGVDPVAYIASGTPDAGSAVYTTVHDGVAYRFASEANMAAFEADPAAYLPQNGGFCTFGVSVGKKLDGDPEYGAVIDGKLYVFLSAAVLDAFNKDRAGTITKAADMWPTIRSTPAADL